jgi:uncharacterized protein YkwD
MVMASIEVQLFYAAVTNVRVAKGLHTQTLSEPLCAGAQQWADEMARTGQFRHGPDDEIIAWHSDPDVDVHKGIEIWRSSPPHWEWLMSKGAQCGFGIARALKGSRRPGTFWVGEFTAGSEVPPTAPSPSVDPWKWFLWRIMHRKIWIP